MAKPKIRHIAMITLDPERMAKFYEETFEMKRLHSTGKAIFMTDGYITMALLPNVAEGKAPGLNHFGWHVEDGEEIAQRMMKQGLARPAKRPADRPYAETRGTDPDGNNFDISVHGYDRVETAVDREKKAKAPATA